MLSEWKLYNFKPFKELTNFSLGPVTVLAGPNSSGKTALLQSILLLTQTLSSPVTTRPLVLNGELVKLGMWDDVAHGDSQDEAVTFDCSVDLPPRLLEVAESRRHSARRSSLLRRRLLEGGAKVKLHVSFDQGKGKMKPILPPMIKEVMVGVEKWGGETKRRAGRPSEYSITVRRRGKMLDAKRLDALSRMLPETIEKDVLNYKVHESSMETSPRLTAEVEFLEGPPGAEAIIGSTFRHFLPDRLVRQYDATTRQLREDIIALLGNQLFVKSRSAASRDLAKLMQETMFHGSNKVPDDLTRSITGFLGAFGIDEKLEGSTTKDFARFVSNLPSKLRPHGKQTRMLADALPYILYSQLEDFVVKEARKVSIAVRPISSIARAGEEVLEDFFTNMVRYLGPLRDDPKVIYELPPTPDIPDVGIKGQYTAVVLDRNKDTQILFVDPARGSQRRASLQEAVVSWLQHMDMLKSVSTKEEGKLGYRLTVSVSELERELDLTTVGVGVSQVLPILVMALLASPGTLMIFEQPEIHLHPKVQSLLGDFFLSMGQLGKQCLVETHSEYLVNRLRLRIAEATDDEVLKLVKIHFVEREGNAAYLREVRPNEYGAILEWPAGFFDEGMLQAESLIRLSAEKQRSKPKATSNESPS